MLNKEILTERLALIKYLYKIGLEQSKQTETIASFSILSFHDSIEMFLKLLTEHLNIKSDGISFIDYWNKIPTLTLKESMRNLNARRVNIKHRGLLPSKSEIETSKIITFEFFNQNTLPHFDIDFNKISLLSLIHNEDVKAKLEEAQNYLDETKIENCIESVSIAFDELISSYENSKSGYYGKSPFYFGKDLAFLSSFNMGIGRSSENKTEQKLGEFIDKVKDSLDDLQKAVKIMSLGIDYKKYVKFKLLTPIIFKTVGGHRVAQLYGKKKWSKENCQFCIDFVFECSLKLQEFDFDINELIENRDPLNY